MKISTALCCDKEITTPAKLRQSSACNLAVRIAHLNGVQYNRADGIEQAQRSSPHAAHDGPLAAALNPGFRGP
jgi:hypothetical protein